MHPHTHTRTIHIPAEGDEEVEDTENDVGLDQLVVVHLSQELDAAHSPLVELWVVDLKTESNVLQY